MHSSAIIALLAAFGAFAVPPPPAQQDAQAALFDIGQLPPEVIEHIAAGMDKRTFQRFTKVNQHSRSLRDYEPVLASVYTNDVEPVNTAVRDHQPLSLVQRLLDNEAVVGRTANPERDAAMVSAAREGNLPLMALLFERVAPTLYGVGHALEESANSGHVDAVAVLLQHEPRTIYVSDALRMAAANGHLETVQLLAPQPGVRLDQALLVAQQRQQFEVAQYIHHLIPQNAMDLGNVAF